MSRKPVLVSVSALIALASLGCKASGSTAAKDVTVAACDASPTGGHPTASGTIVNHSSKSSGYTIHVKFKDSAGNGVGDGAAVVAKVEAGATANWHADGSVNANGPLTCTFTATRAVSP